MFSEQDVSNILDRFSAETLKIAERAIHERFMRDEEEFLQYNSMLIEALRMIKNLIKIEEFKVATEICDRVIQIMKPLD